MKKKVILSSVLFAAAPLSSLADDTLRSSAVRVQYPEIEDADETSFDLQSDEQVLNGKSGFFLLELNNYFQDPKELQGSFTFQVTGTNFAYYIGGDDGSMVFSMVKDDEEKTEYRGLSCSSTYTDCHQEFMLELVKTKKTGTWEMNLQIDNLNHDEEVLNFARKTIPLTLSL